MKVITLRASCTLQSCFNIQPSHLLGVVELGGVSIYELLAAVEVLGEVEVGGVVGQGVRGPAVADAGCLGTSQPSLICQGLIPNIYKS